MKKHIHTLLTNYKFIAAIVLTVLLSTLPNFHPETYLNLNYTWQLDMLIHGGYYFLLTLLLRYFVFNKSSVFFFASALFFFSVVLELIQLWVPKRSLTLLDVLSNFLGIISGAIFLYYVETKKIKN